MDKDAEKILEHILFEYEQYIDAHINQADYLLQLDKTNIELKRRRQLMNRLKELLNL